MSEGNRTAVRKHFTWTVDEAVELLDRTRDESGFDRATFGACIYWLIVADELDWRIGGDESYVDLVEAAALRAASVERMHAAAWALVLRVFWAGNDGQTVFDALLLAQPALGRSDLAQQIALLLADHGYISL